MSLAHQLEGFYAVEDGWRWTSKHPVVLMAAPENSKKVGAVLRFKFTIPDPAAKAYGSQTVSAKIGGTTLGQRKFDGAGSHEYTAEVPADALQTEPVRVELTFGNTFKVPADARELAVIALEAELAAK